MSGGNWIKLVTHVSIIGVDPSQVFNMFFSGGGPSSFGGSSFFSGGSPFGGDSGFGESPFSSFFSSGGPSGGGGGSRQFKFTFK